MAVVKAKEKAKKMGKVWDRLGHGEKMRLIDVEMKAAGYEKKPGNQQYTKVPTEKEKEFADKARADDRAASKMSDDDKVDYYSKNTHLSHGGKNVSDEGKKKIAIARLESQKDALEKAAMKAGQKAAAAEERGDDMAFEKYQDEEEAYLDRARSLESKIDDMKES